MTNLKTSFESGLQDLRTLRDEIRVRIHLAGQEARTQWETHLEPHYSRIEQQIKEAKDDTVEAVKDAIDRAKTAYQDFRARLGGDDQSKALDGSQDKTQS